MMHETQRMAAIHVDDAEPATRVPVPGPKAFRPKSIFLILFAALLVNAAIVLVGLPKVSRPLAPTYSMSFGDLYDLIAKNLEQGNGYRVDANMSLTMLREPAYPLFLAAVFKLGGYSIQTARVACVLLAFGVALMLLQLARKITGDAMTALSAALLFLLYPGTLVAEARAGIEIPFIFTVILFMLGALQRSGEGKPVSVLGGRFAAGGGGDGKEPGFAISAPFVGLPRLCLEEHERTGENRVADRGARRRNDDCDVAMGNPQL